MSTGLPNQPASAEPGLDHLFRALTADGHPYEVARRDAALAMFRDATRMPRRHAFRPGWLTRPASPPPRSTARTLLPGRLVTVCVAGALAVAGVTAAAYAQALPAPVQQIAYSVFAPLGVPNSPPQPARTGTRSRLHGSTPRGAAGPSTVAAPGAGQASSGAPTSPAPTASGTPTGGYALTLAATKTSVPTGGFDVFTGKLTRRGQPAAGLRVRLLEHAAGASGWQLAAAASTGPRGGVRFTLTHLASSATFRLAGPDGAGSAPVAVTVLPRFAVQLKLVLGQTNDLLTASAPDGQPGDLVRLAELRSGTWTAIATAPLGVGQTVTFTLPASSAGGHFYRAVLPKTGAHPIERSTPVWVPKHHTGAKVIGTPAPTPSDTPAPTASPTPTASATPSGTPAPTASAPDPSASDPAPTASATPTASPTRHRHRGRRAS